MASGGGEPSQEAIITPEEAVLPNYRPHQGTLRHSGESSVLWRLALFGTTFNNRSPTSLTGTTFQIHGRDTGRHEIPEAAGDSIRRIWES